MTILLIFAIASMTASTLVVSACVVSSRFSQQEMWEEHYEVSVSEVNWKHVPSTSS
jgi:hypothetical protein